jgi:hypothetical protein
MVTEYAARVSRNIDYTDLQYLCKKANKLGKEGFSIVRVFSKEDGDKIDIFFEIQSQHEVSIQRRIHQYEEAICH